MTKPLLCKKCKHRKSEHKLTWLDSYTLELGTMAEDIIQCQICSCVDFNTCDENLRGVKK